MRKLLLFTLAIAAITITCCPYQSSGQKRVAQKAVQLQRQNVFTQQVNVLALASSQFDEHAQNTITNYTMLDLSSGINDVVNNQPDYLRMTVPIDKGNNSLTVLLYKTDISPNGFKMETNAGTLFTPEKKPVNYRGIVEGNSGSISAFTFAEGEVMGLISNGGGNYVVGKLEGNTSAKHIIYNDADLVPAFNFECGTNTANAPVLNTKDLNLPATQSVNCVNWYWEIDYDVFVGKGSLANVNTYINGIFNQVSTLYDNDGMDITLQTVYVWTSTDPYTGPSTSDYLNQFGANRTSFTGDLANLIGYQGSGGIAWVNGICASTSHRMAYAGISSSYQTVPTYSWTVEVVAHEEGHLFGSSHTHDCKWNGNNTRIDNCGPAAGYNTGSCAAGPIPTKGTIMSYCHLSPNPGIDLSLGFGPQPTALMLNRVNTASCLTACGGCTSPAQPGTVSGNGTVCTGTSQTYSVAAVSGATSYTWTLPSGWSGTSTTNSITVTAGSAGGTISVIASNSCGNSPVRTFAVSIGGSVPAQPGTISGNASVCASTSQTYSVAVVSGATSYTWTLPSGWSGTSATNSITTTAGTAGGSITVRANNGCGSSAVRSLTVSISGSVPAQPGTISGNASVCASTSQTYSVAVVSGATSYTWTLPSGWSGTSATNSITTTAGTAGGSITVRANNGCGSSAVRSLTVAISGSVPAQPGTISGNASVCASTSQTYSVAVVSGATSYTWTLPSGWSGTSATNSITTTAGTAGGSITVRANNGCGSSAVRSLTVAISGSVPAQPGTISGNASVCASTSQTYSVAVVSGATSYTWTLPSGWSGTSTTNSITTTAGTAGGSITVRANNGCGSSAVRSLTVAISGSVPAQPATISGNASVCTSTLQTYSVAVVPGATSYTWTLPSGWSGTSTTNSITTTAGTAGGSITVRANNGCGSSAVRSFTVAVTTSAPARPGAITGSSTACANQQGVPYSISPVAGATSYKWIVPSGSRISDGTTTSTGNNLITTATSVTVNFGATSGNVRVRAINGCGMSPARIKTVTFNCREAGAMITEEDILDVKVYPNPSASEFNIAIENAEEQDISIYVYDGTGRLAKPVIEKAGSVVKISGLPPGIYSAVIKAKGYHKTFRLVKTD